jgi:hypothetical protein
MANAIAMITRCGHNQLATALPSVLDLGAGVMPPARPSTPGACTPPWAHTWLAGHSGPGVRCACGEVPWPEWAFCQMGEETT